MNDNENSLIRRWFYNDLPNKTREEQEEFFQIMFEKGYDPALLKALAESYGIPVDF